MPTHKVKSPGLRVSTDWPNAMEPRSGRENKQSWKLKGDAGGKRHRDSEWRGWWTGSMKCPTVLPKQHDMHSGIKEPLQPLSPTVFHRCWPHCWSLALLITEIAQHLNTSYGSVWQGNWIKMFALPTCSHPGLSDTASLSHVNWCLIKDAVKKS